MARLWPEPPRTEPVSLNPLGAAAGAHSAILGAAVAASSRRGAVRMDAATTNDHLEAVRFYRRHGMRLEHVRPGAVDTARADKPSIPLERDGMAIHDEWVLVRPLP